jgi:hypothetical protein
MTTRIRWVVVIGGPGMGKSAILAASLDTSSSSAKVRSWRWLTPGWRLNGKVSSSRSSGRARRARHCVRAADGSGQIVPQFCRKRAIPRNRGSGRY